METTLAYALKAVALPPGIQILLGALAVALLLLKRARVFALSLLVIAFVSLGALSLPAIARSLAATLETFPALPPDGVLPPGPQAIVVLGTTRYSAAPEYGRDTVGAALLQRVRYAAELHARTGLPILTAGGKPMTSGPAEAELMRDVLQAQFRAPVEWLEMESRNTSENARFSRTILQPAGVDKIYLVTHAMHMPRAAEAFRMAGFEVTPAPTGFIGHREVGADLLDWLPSAEALTASRNALHEHIGRWWYRLRYY